MVDSENKILIMSMYFHPEPNGSAPPIADLSRWLVENDYMVDVITARPNYPDGVVFDGYRKGEKDREVWFGVNVKRLNLIVPKSRGILGRLVSEISFVGSLLKYRLLNKEKYSNIISVCPSIFTVLAVRFFKAKKAKHLIIVHDIQSGLGASVMNVGPIIKLLRKTEKLAFNSASQLVTLAEGMKDELEKIGVNRPIHILPPQVNCKEITVLPEVGSGVPVLLYSGALGKKQGLIQVLEVAEIFQERSISAQFIIRGQGGELAFLKETAKGLNLKNLTFEPLVPRDQINSALAEAVVHLVPQLEDGANFCVPSKIFSIMSAGRPFVATCRIDSPLGILVSESQAGAIVPPGDINAFADELERLIKTLSERREMGEKGRQYIETTVDREVVCQQMVELLLDS